MGMGRRVNVIGVGMVPFAKPGRSEAYNIMAAKAIRAALEDCGVDYREIKTDRSTQWIYTPGLRVQYRMGRRLRFELQTGRRCLQLRGLCWFRRLICGCLKPGICCGISTSCHAGGLMTSWQASRSKAVQ